MRLYRLKESLLPSLSMIYALICASDSSFYWGELDTIAFMFPPLSLLSFMFKWRGLYRCWFRSDLSVNCFTRYVWLYRLHRLAKGVNPCALLLCGELTTDLIIGSLRCLGVSSTTWLRLLFSWIGLRTTSRSNSSVLRRILCWSPCMMSFYDDEWVSIFIY